MSVREKKSDEHFQPWVSGSEAGREFQRSSWVGPSRIAFFCPMQIYTLKKIYLSIKRSRRTAAEEPKLSLCGVKFVS